jgi:hypothetical protein
MQLPLAIMLHAGVQALTTGSIPACYRDLAELCRREHRGLISDWSTIIGDDEDAEVAYRVWI